MGTLRGGSPKGTATGTTSRFGSLNPNQCGGKHAYYNYPCTKKKKKKSTTAEQLSNMQLQPSIDFTM